MLQSKSHVQTLMQRVILVHSDENSPIQRNRQRSAFPPNFIHCLDSSHMMLTAIDCAKAGMNTLHTCVPSYALTNTSVAAHPEVELLQ